MRSCVKNTEEDIKRQNAPRYQLRRLTTWEDKNDHTITSNKRFLKHTWKLQQRLFNNFQQRGFQTRDNKPQQRPNLWDHTAKLEEALTKLIEVVITNHKNIKAAIKSMKTQIRQLAKQLQTSSIGFSIATEENPKGHCKAIISTIECDMGGEEEEVEESTVLEEDMKAQASPSTQGMQSSLNPPLFDFIH